MNIYHPAEKLKMPDCSCAPKRWKERVLFRAITPSSIT